MAYLSRIQNDWLRTALLVLVIPAHFVGLLLDTLAGCPRLLGERTFYNNCADIYGALLAGALAKQG
jgi:hypothetical protein